MADKKKQEKTARVLTRTLAEILSGASSYRDESTRLRRLSMETGPDLEDQLIMLRERLERVHHDPAALDDALAGLSTEVFAAVVEVLAQRRQLAPLLRLKDRQPGREEQKTIGAALHKLQTQGIELPKATPHGAPARSLEPPQAWMAIRNAYGNAMLSLFIPGEREDIIAHGMLEELDGLGEFTYTDQGARAERRELLRGFKEKQLPVFEIPVTHALFLLREAMERARSRHIMIPLEVTEFVHRLEDRGYRAEQARPAGVDETKPRTSTGLGERSPIVIRPEVMSWHVDRSVLEPIFGRFIEIAGSQVVVSEQVRTDQIAELMRESATQYFTPERRQRFARRLEDLSLWFDHLGLRIETEWAWGTALALRDPSIAISNIPFAVSFLELRVMYLLQEMLPPGAFERLQQETHEDEAPTPPDGPRIILP